LLSSFPALIKPKNDDSSSDGRCYCQQNASPVFGKQKILEFIFFGRYSTDNSYSLTKAVFYNFVSFSFKRGILIILDLVF